MLSPVPVGRGSRKVNTQAQPRRTESFIVGRRQDWWGHTLLVLITSISIAALIIVTIYLIWMVGTEVMRKIHQQQLLHPVASSADPTMA